MRQQVCRFTVSVSCRFWFLPLSIFSQLVFWNVKICPSAAFTAVVSASVRCCFFIPHLLLSVFISLSLQSDRHGRMCCLCLCSSYGFSFFSSFSVRFFLLPLFSPSLFPCFCAEDENIGLVGCLLSSLWEFFLWFFATRCESDGSGQTNWPTAHC